MPDADVLYHDAAHAATAWWMRLITDPERDRPATSDAAAVFATALEAGIIEGLAADAARAELLARESGSRPDRTELRLRVDYKPTNALVPAAEAAGIDYRSFTSKTTMFVRPDHVIVSWGYCAPHRLVWAAASWERPPCDKMRPEDDWYGFGDWNAHPDLMMCGLARYHDGPCGDWIPDTSACTGCGRPQTAHYTAAGWEAADRCRYKDPELSDA